MADAGEMDANLMLAAGQQIELQQCEVFGLLEHPIARARQFSLCPVRRRIHDVSFVLRQVSRDRSRRLGTLAMNDREIFLLGVLPSILQTKLRLGVLGEDDYPRDRKSTRLNSSHS